MDKNIIEEITINTREKGFDIKGKGMSEQFVLNLVRTLRGEGTVEMLAEPINFPRVYDPEAIKLMEDLAKPSAIEKHPKQSTNISDIGTSDLLSKSVMPKLEPVIKDTISTVLAPKITTVKERPSYKVDTNDGLVHSFGEKSAPSFGEKFGSQAKALYAKAGVEHKEQSDDFHHTGIKYGHDDKPKFRLGYECPKCGNTGRHYIPFHITRVSCHNCQTALVVEPATKHGICNSEKCRDEKGNFLIAKQIDMNAPVHNRDK